MQGNAALLALSGLLVVGLLGGPGVAGGGEAPPAPAPAAAADAPIKQIGAEGLVLATTSSSDALSIPRRPTTASGHLLLDQPCTSLVVVGAVPATTDVQVFHSYRTRAMTVTVEPVGVWCALVVELPIAPDEPATGVFLVGRSSAPVVSAPPTAISYTVERSTPLATFAWIAAVALYLGALCALQIYVLLRDRTDGPPLPKQYGYEKPWSSITAAVTATGSSLLAGGGVLAAFAPQYQTDGIAVANLVVVASIAVAPAIVGAFYAEAEEEGKRRTLAVAGGVTVAAIVAQFGLDGVYVFQTDVSASGFAWLMFFGVLVLTFLAFYVVRGLVTLRETTPTAS